MISAIKHKTWSLVPAIEVTMVDYLNTGDELIEIGKRKTKIELEE